MLAYFVVGKNTPGSCTNSERNRRVHDAIFICWHQGTGTDRQLRDVIANNTLLHYLYFDAGELLLARTVSHNI